MLQTQSFNFSLRDVVVAGEQLQITPAVRTMFSRRWDARLHNQYGPSETHVVTAFTLTGDPDDWMPLPPIGTPVANTFVLRSGYRRRTGASGRAGRVVSRRRAGGSGLSCTGVS